MSYYDKWLDMNFIGIPANYEVNGVQLLSGMKVKRGTEKEYTVRFEPNHGIMVGGENLADVYITEIVSKPTNIQILKGRLTFIYFLFTGKTLT